MGRMGLGRWRGLNQHTLRRAVSSLYVLAVKVALLRREFTGRSEKRSLVVEFLAP